MTRKDSTRVSPCRVSTMRRVSPRTRDISLVFVGSPSRASAPSCRAQLRQIYGVSCDEFETLGTVSDRNSDFCRILFQTGYSEYCRANFFPLFRQAISSIKRVSSKRRVLLILISFNEVSTRFLLKLRPTLRISKKQTGALNAMNILESVFYP